MEQNIHCNDELFLLGAREYVHALPQLKFSWHSIMALHHIQDPSLLSVRRYKQLKELKSPARLVATNRGKKSDEESVAVMEFWVNGEYRKFDLVAVPGSLKRRPEHPYAQTDQVFDRDSLAAVALIKQPVDYWTTLEEAIQLTKLLHIHCYNSAGEEGGYQFVVGGFERLDYFRPAEEGDLTLRVTIRQSLKHENQLYNTVVVRITQRDSDYKFVLPFIGKSSA